MYDTAEQGVRHLLGRQRRPQQQKGRHQQDQHRESGIDCDHDTLLSLKQLAMHYSSSLYLDCDIWSESLPMLVQ
jgi:hypothetical protein